jgi:hypothetical protein
MICAAERHKKIAGEIVQAEAGSGARRHEKCAVAGNSQFFPRFF